MLQSRLTRTVPLALAAFVAWPVIAVAQQGTPVADSGGLPITPDPAECVVAPRTIEEIEELVGTPGSPVPPDAGDGAGSPPPRPTTLPGVPADDETVEAVVATVRQFVACVNAGDELRGYALYTDEFVRTSVFVDASLAQPAVPEPPERRVALLDVVYVREYPDGRVGAVIVIDDPLAPSPVEPYFFVFRKVGDRWLFDEWPTTVYFERDAGPAGNAAPAPPARQREGEDRDRDADDRDAVRDVPGGVSRQPTQQVGM